MTRLQRIRHEVLLQLYAARPLAVTAEAIAKRAQREADELRDLSLEEVKAELMFLRDELLVMRNIDATGVIRYSITSKGCLLRENGE